MERGSGRSRACCREKSSSSSPRGCKALVQGPTTRFGIGLIVSVLLALWQAERGPDRRARSIGDLHVTAAPPRLSEEQHHCQVDLCRQVMFSPVAHSDGRTSSAKQQHEQDDQQYDADTAATTAEMVEPRAAVASDNPRRIRSCPGLPITV
jgi:hypothetical protein